MLLIEQCNFHIYIQAHRLKMEDLDPKKTLNKHIRIIARQVLFRYSQRKYLTIPHHHIASDTTIRHGRRQ